MSEVYVSFIHTLVYRFFRNIDAPNAFLTVSNNSGRLLKIKSLKIEKMLWQSLISA